MDPRHPELALPRIKELTKQFDRVLADISKESVSNRLGELEREGILVVQEISLVAPRLHEMVIQASRQRRQDIARGVAFGYKPEEKVGKYTKATIGIVEKPVDTEKISVTQKRKETVSKKETTTAVEESSATCSKAEQVGPKKKTTTKKTTKKAKK